MKFHGTHLPDYKNTINGDTLELPLPEQVRISMSQHMGAPCQPRVKIGDEVKVGQRIGDSESFVSAPIHSSVSGTVTAIKDLLLANGKSCKVVEITCDGKQTMSEDITPPNITDKSSLVKAVKESGCCGLGGAGFPTHIKLNYDENKTRVDSLVINAAECEPYITSDYHEMMENTDNVFEGMTLLKDTLNIEKVYLCIEANKPKAIELFNQRLAGMEGYKVVKLPKLYPQGAEKVVAYAATKRVIGEDCLPSDAGIVVMNISTVSFIAQYAKTGIPLISRRVTVDGDAINVACNIRAPIGTKISDILKYTDTNLAGIHKLVSGGPMMGVSVYDFDTPLCKTNNAFIGFKKPVKTKGLVVEQVQTNCIRCGRCIEACPMKLMPTQLEKAYDRMDRDALNKLKVNLCMNCGSCTYVCPAKRNISEKIQLAKGFAISK